MVLPDVVTCLSISQYVVCITSQWNINTKLKLKTEPHGFKDYVLGVCVFMLFVVSYYNCSITIGFSGMLDFLGAYITWHTVSPRDSSSRIPQAM